MASEHGRPLQLSDNVFDRLRIPMQNRESFCAAIQQLIEHERQPHEYWYWLAGEVRRPLERIASLCEQLANALREADCQSGRIGCGVHIGLEYELRCARDLPDHLRHDPNADLVRQYEQTVLFLAARAKDAAADAVENLKETGRPEGVGGHPGLLEFIDGIVYRVLHAGGNIGVDARGDGGSLVALLEELRPHLPSKFMPEHELHPTTTYSRRIERAKSSL